MRFTWSNIKEFLALFIGVFLIFFIWTIDKDIKNNHDYQIKTLAELCRHENAVNSPLTGICSDPEIQTLLKNSDVMRF